MSGVCVPKLLIVVLAISLGLKPQAVQQHSGGFHFPRPTFLRNSIGPWVLR
jgi:hypothetical protein